MRYVHHGILTKTVVRVAVHVSDLAQPVRDLEAWCGEEPADLGADLIAGVTVRRSSDPFKKDERMRKCTRPGLTLAIG